MIRERIRNYFKKRSKLNLAGDAVFAILLVMLLIPGPRRVIMSNVIRLVSFQPSRVESTPLTLTSSEYQWSLMSMDGQEISFADLKGKVVFLNHWATWCPHCVAEMPSIEKLYADYGDKVVFLLLTHEQPTVVEPFMEKRDWGMPWHYPLSRVPRMLDTEALPRTYIIGPDGRIYLDKTGAAKWDGQKVRDLLDELLAKQG